MDPASSRGLFWEQALGFVVCRILEVTYLLLCRSVVGGIYVCFINSSLMLSVVVGGSRMYEAWKLLRDEPMRLWLH